MPVLLSKKTIFRYPISPCLVISIFFSFMIHARADEWNELKGEHFIVYSTSGSKFAQHVLTASESHYRRISSDLGYARHSSPWTWDKRVRIFIYRDRPAYLKATNESEWSEGVADYKKKEIFSYEWSRGFSDSLLPHEIAHLIFSDFLALSKDLPVWLSEGVAQWEEGPRMRSEIKKKAKDLYQKDSLLSVKDILMLNIKIVKKNEKRVYFRGVRTKRGRIGLVVFSPDVLINTYYIEAGSLVGFLIETFGADRFAELCRHVRDGKSFEDAIGPTYAEHMRTIKELEEKWRKYLSQ